MTQKIINTGIADKGNGDPIRTAFTKVNDNFAELYSQLAASVVVGATAPTGPEEGSLWWNSVSGRMYVYFGTAWVDASPVDGAGISSTNQLVNGAYTTSLGANGVLTLADGSIINGATLKTIAGNYAGITAGPASPAGKDEDSWMWVDNNGATIATKYSTDAHTWTFNNSGALTFPQGTTIATADGTDAFIIDGAVDKDIQIYTYSGPTPTAHGWTFGTDGNLTVPDRITFSDDTWQSTAFIGHAYSLRNNPTGSLYVTLDDSGTINTPLLLPKTFTAVLNPAHYVGEGTLVLEGTAWEYTVQFQVGMDGGVQTMIDNLPWVSNPGYIDGLAFEFVEADHGIPGYTFTLTLTDVQNPGPMMYTANIAVSPPPAYPATVKSLGAVKLTANDQSLTLGTSGNVDFPTVYGTRLTVSGSEILGYGALGLGSSNNLISIVANFDGTPKQWTFGTTGNITFPDTSTYGNSTLTGAVDSDLAFEVKHRTTVSAVESVGDAVGGMFSTDITTNDDITVVGAGWQLNAGTELAPEWIPVFEGIESNPGVYNILIAQIDLPVGFEFVQGSTYTFRNPTPVSKVWTINNQNGTLIAPGNAILSNETAPLGGGGTYRDFSIELPTPDESNEQRWTFSNDGAITFPNGVLKIAGNTISNYVADDDLGSGSQLEVSQSKTVITNGVTNSLGGGGPSLISQFLFEVSTNGILSSFQAINTLGEGESTLTGEYLTELDNNSFKIGQRITNDLGDSSEPLVAFSGWTFGTVDQQLALTLPAGGAIAESTNTFNIIGLTPAGPTGVPSSISGGVASTNAFWDQNPLSNLATTLGSGTGLTVTVTQTEGVAIAIAIVNPGTGYTNGELISVTSGTANAMFYINTVDYNETEWTFGCTGALTFPDATVQTTAYQKVAVPAHSYGVAGDKTGMLAFDADYIYYCTADYSTSIGIASVTISTPISRNDSLHWDPATTVIEFSPPLDFTTNPAGDIIPGGVAATGTPVFDGSGDLTGITIDTAGSGYLRVADGGSASITDIFIIQTAGAGGNSSREIRNGLPVGVTISLTTTDIWKRTAHGAGTW